MFEHNDVTHYPLKGLIFAADDQHINIEILKQNMSTLNLQS